MSPDIPKKNIPTQALVIEKPKSPFVLRNVVIDEVRDDELLIEMLYTGVCHTVSSQNVPSAVMQLLINLKGSRRTEWRYAHRRFPGYCRT